MTFQEIRQKDVVNVSDGRKLGKPTDLIISPDARVDAIVMPGGGGLSALFHRDAGGIVVPWGNIRRFGDDVILVEVDIPCET